ncbi:MAG: hypothetical protein ACLPSO_16195 [Terracidiphilus sp.]
MIVAALTVSKSFSLHHIIRNNWFAASPHASGNAAGIITAKRFAPILSTPKWCRKAGKSGAMHIPTTSSSTGSGTRKRSSGTANSSRSVTNATACSIL